MDGLSHEILMFCLSALAQAVMGDIWQGAKRHVAAFTRR
jgi:hypothetical protein